MVQHDVLDRNRIALRIHDFGAHPDDIAVDLGRWSELDAAGQELWRLRLEGCEPVAALAGKPARLRFVMKDADLYSIRFRN